MNMKEFDYDEQDIYEYFGGDKEILKADKYSLLAIIGGMSWMLELLWHKEIPLDRAFEDFKKFVIDKRELENIQVEVVEDEA